MNGSKRGVFTHLHILVLIDFVLLTRSVETAGKNNVRVYVCVCVREFVELAGQNPPMICQDKLRATATAGKTPRQQRSSDW